MVVNLLGVAIVGHMAAQVVVQVVVRLALYVHTEVVGMAAQFL